MGGRVTYSDMGPAGKPGGPWGTAEGLCNGETSQERILRRRTRGEGGMVKDACITLFKILKTIKAEPAKSPAVLPSQKAK